MNSASLFWTHLAAFQFGTALTTWAFGRPGAAAVLFGFGVADLFVAWLIVRSR